MKINIKNIRVKSICATLFISLFLSCNNSGESAEAEKRLTDVLMDVGRSTENAFYSFIELISDTLGLRVTRDTKKSQVGEYFSILGEKLGKTADALEQVAVKAVSDIDKDGLLSKAIREAVDSAKKTLEVLKGHLESLKDIGDSSQNIGEAVSNAGAKEGVAANQDKLKKVLTAFQGIVDEAVKVGVAKPEAGTLALNNATGVDNKDGAKILSTNSNTKPSPGDECKAATILATVSGKDMLASIVQSKENDSQIGGSGADGNTTAVSFAIGNSGSTVAQNSAKAAALAGGIALRSLVKDGKLARAAADGSAGEGKEIQGVGVTAVNKLLVAVEDLIKKTVKNAIGKAKEKINKAKSSQESVSEAGNK
ncbi:variable large family protein (plasmid) [Borrelia coriaceae]|uniref:variable large family protein n=1 Tax=Borrelia coriaceae TaxID=144 RepID=UPI0004AF4BE5|nr:variable large family protein [Borrelia coriaceae]UPA17327.1 variable large family protein [Borrelia coriaceae]